MFYPIDKIETRPLPRIQLTWLTGVEIDQKPDTKISARIQQDWESHFDDSSQSQRRLWRSKEVFSRERTG